MKINPTLREDVKFDKNIIGKQNVDVVIKDLKYAYAYIQSIANRDYVFSTGLFNSDYDLDIATNEQLTEINYLVNKIHGEMVDLDKAIRRAQDNR